MKDDLTHNGYKYKEGLNRLSTDFLLQVAQEICKALSLAS